MLQAIPHEYLQITARAGTGADWTVEQELMDFSHPIVGALLSDRWCFARDTCEVIRLHHENAENCQDEEASQKVVIVRAADLIAHRAGHGYRAGASDIDVELQAALADLSITEEEAERLSKSIVQEFEWQALIA
jgi:HD-like signal output (HDOD) protein